MKITGFTNVLLYGNKKPERTEKQKNSTLVNLILNFNICKSIGDHSLSTYAKFPRGKKC